MMQILCYVIIPLIAIVSALAIEFISERFSPLPKNHLTWSSWFGKFPHVIDPEDGSAHVIHHATHVCIPLFSIMGGLILGSLMLGNVICAVVGPSVSEIGVKAALGFSCAIALWIMWARKPSLHRCAGTQDIVRKYQNTVDEVNLSDG
jgi:hypothetical protein